METDKKHVKPKYKKFKKKPAKQSAPPVINKPQLVSSDQKLKNRIEESERDVLFTVEVEVLSPISLTSGQADVNKDSEVVHDKYGLPYFPAKRLKGLLYESAVEVKEMAEAAGMCFIKQETIDELFQHEIETKVRLIAEDLHLSDYEIIKPELAYLEKRYPEIIRKEDVLQEFTSIRYQTAINKETGTALIKSLRNLRVLDEKMNGKTDENIVFTGKWKICNAQSKHLEALALAMQNLNSVGSKRNRGFGQINCVMTDQVKLVGQALGKDVM